MIALNECELIQYRELVSRIRQDSANTPRPARSYIPLVRGRVCAYLNQQVDLGIIRDIKVNRAQETDEYFHI